MMKNPNSGWDYHIPLDHRMVKKNISSTIHPHAIF